MADMKPGSDSAPIMLTRTGVGREAACNAEGPTLEKAAAIAAVLALMQAEAHPEADPPRASAWARAGRREAVRPWPERE
jgi:hypothetical protein